MYKKLARTIAVKHKFQNTLAQLLLLTIYKSFICQNFKLEILNFQQKLKVFSTVIRFGTLKGTVKFFGEK